MTHKKGMLMAGTVLIFAFLLTYAAWTLLIDKSPTDEKLRLGQMTQDVYDADNEADEFLYYLEKSGEYAVVEALDERIQSGKLMDDCDVLYSTTECWFNPGKIVKDMEKESQNNFKKYIQKNSYGLAVDDYTIELSFDGMNITVKGTSKNPVDFGKESERELSFRTNLNFENKIKFNFSEYSVMFKEINEKITCLKESEDEQVKDDIASNNENKKKPGECLGEKYKNVKKTNGILSFDYEIEGVLMENLFEGSMKVDILGFEKSKDIAVG